MDKVSVSLPSGQEIRNALIAAGGLVTTTLLVLAATLHSVNAPSLMQNPWWGYSFSIGCMALALGAYGFIAPFFSFLPELEPKRETARYWRASIVAILGVLFYVAILIYDSQHGYPINTILIRTISLYPWILNAGIAIVVISLCCMAVLRRPAPLIPNPPPSDLISATESNLQYVLKITQDDLESTRLKLAAAELELMEYKGKLSEKFPKIKATIIEILAGDLTPEYPDLHLAVIIGISNSGRRSLVHNYKISAHTVYGAAIDIEPLYNDKFSLIMNEGKDRIDYLPEHYIFERTTTPIEEGIPVIGVLPCRLSGIKDIKDVNLLSFKVSFIDGVGDIDGNAKHWDSMPLSPGQMSHIAIPKYRPGLPFIRPAS